MVNPYDILNYEIICVQRPSLIGWNVFYVIFNYIEAVFWFGIALYVLFRYIKNRKTWYELLYTLSFFVFGVTDLIEVWGMTLGVLLLKGVCLLAIFQGRKLVIEKYPDKKF
jgi:hypothetical protein